MEFFLEKKVFMGFLASFCNIDCIKNLGRYYRQMVRTTNMYITVSRFTNLHLAQQIQNAPACSDQLNLLVHVIIGSTPVKQTYHGTHKCYLPFIQTLTKS